MICIIRIAARWSHFNNFLCYRCNAFSVW